MPSWPDRVDGRLDVRRREPNQHKETGPTCQRASIRQGKGCSQDEFKSSSRIDERLLCRDKIGEHGQHRFCLRKMSLAEESKCEHDTDNAAPI